jgi:hypothetical protein
MSGQARSSMWKDGAGYALLVVALTILLLGVDAVRSHDYVAAILVLGTGLAVLRAAVTLLRPSIGE